jgi:peptide subunit release factor 1 (eRF1)
MSDYTRKLVKCFSCNYVKYLSLATNEESRVTFCRKCNTATTWETHLSVEATKPHKESEKER